MVRSLKIKSLICTFLLSTCMINPTSVKAQIQLPTSFLSDHLIDEQTNQQSHSITELEIIEIAKSLLFISNDFELAHITHTSIEQRQVWNLEFNKMQGKQIIAQIQLTIDAETNTLTRYNYIRHEHDFDEDTDLTNSELGNSALAFIQTVFPAYEEQINHTPKITHLQNERLKFDYERIIHHIPYANDGIELIMDRFGNIMQYHLNWNFDLQVEDILEPTILSKQAAMEKLRSQIRPKLIYVYPEQATDPKLQLAYEFQLHSVHASTGEILNDFIQHPLYYGALPPLTSTRGVNEHKKKLNNEAEAIAQANQLLSIPTNAKLESITHAEVDLSGNAHWNLHWLVKEQEEQYSIWVTLDQKNGQVLNIRNEQLFLNADSTNETKEHRKQKIAIDFVKKLVPEFTHQLILLPAQDSDMYDLTFQRVVNGIPVLFDQIQLDVDELTGEIVNFNNQLTYENFEEKPVPSFMTELLKEQILEQVQLELRYEVNNTEEEHSIIPVYHAVSTNEAKIIYVDSFQETENIEPTMQHPQNNMEELENHWAKDSLRLMLEYDALEWIHHQLLPDQWITRQEWIRMVMSIQGSELHEAPSTDLPTIFIDVDHENPYYTFIEAAVSQQILDASQLNLHPNEQITREEVAYYLGLLAERDGLIRNPSIYRLSVQDEEEFTHENQVAIAIALGFMNREDGFFKPQKFMTRAEASTALAKYVKYKDNKQRQSIELLH